MIITVSSVAMGCFIHAGYILFSGITLSYRNVIFSGRHQNAVI
ncbi:hypothetical protein F385_254 [Pantoea agglomerans 299R]|nr:hypothetical protein F385_254 [Pantoea agglomerans 299R]